MTVQSSPPPSDTGQRAADGARGGAPKKYLGDVGAVHAGLGWMQSDWPPISRAPSRSSAGRSQSSSSTADSRIRPTA